MSGLLALGACAIIGTGVAVTRKRGRTETEVVILRKRARTATTLDAPSQIIIEPIPDFEALGYTDADLIREELRRGPSFDFHIGPRKIHFTLPLRLVVYCSPFLAQMLKSSPDKKCLELPDHDLLAFAKVQTWLNEGKFGPSVLNQCIDSGMDTRTGIEDACILLCWMTFLAENIRIFELQTLCLSDLRRATSLAREMGHSFPMAPEMVMEIYHRSGKPSAFLDLVVEEMKAAALEKGLDASMYWECFRQCPGLSDEVLEDGIAEGIFAAWGRMAEDEIREGKGSPMVDAGKEVGWWKGLF